MIRALRPTDVLSYLAFRNQSPANEALVQVGGRAIAPALSALPRGSQLLEPTGARWVAIERGQIAGLVAARSRFGADTWDVDQLLISPRIDSPDRVYSRLLDHLCARAVEEGVQKVLLRLNEDSEAVVAAGQASFFRYTTEDVYVYSYSGQPPAHVAIDGLRPRRPIDHQPLFQLYTAAVPAYVRQVEGLTLQEWRWTDGWSSRRMSWRPGGGDRRDFVVWGGDSLTGWLRLGSRSRSIALLDDGREPGLAPEAISFGLAHLGQGAPASVTVRDYQAGLTPWLAERGFRLVARHVLLARALAIRVPELKLVPVLV